VKILYVSIKYDYGKLERGYSSEHYNFYDALVKMDNKKHQVVYFPFDEIMAKIGRDEMNAKLLETVRAEKPELCFFCLFTDEIKKETIRKISQNKNTITFNWFTDDHWRFVNFSKYWAPLFNWVSTTDSQAPEKYKKLGYKNVIKTQWACNHFLYKRQETRDRRQETRYDVSFVGQAHSNRKEIIEKIKKAGINIECFGAGWPAGRVSQIEMIKIFSQSKINLNFTESSGGLRLKPIAKIFLNRRTDNSYHLCSPRYWPVNFQSFLAKKRTQIKGRNFEIPGCGGFLLTKSADNLEDYYSFGKPSLPVNRRGDKEIEVFNGTNDLIKKIKYYLTHEDERKSIAEAGYQKTIEEHTYEKRFRKIFKKILN